MERRNSKEWIKALKIAFINEDIEKLKKFSKENPPSFSSIQEAKEALKLIENITKFLTQKKNQIKIEMQKLKQLQNYNNIYKNSETNEWKI